MVRLIVLTFVGLGFSFYELSGGPDFEPDQWRKSSAPEVETQTLPNSDPPSKRNVVLIPTKSNPTGSETSATANVIFTSLPTTRRLVGAAIPTPVAQKTAIGRGHSLMASQDVTKAERPTLILEEGKEPDFRQVTGNRVNMRNGPGTQYPVVGTLMRDDAVEVLQDPGIGWVKLQVIETRRVGWMSARLLSRSRY